MKKAIIIYMPVLHAGYVNFLESKKPIDTIFLISKDVLSFFNPTMATTLERDLRALPVFTIKHILQDLGIAKNVKILKHDNLDLFDQVIVPNDEITEEFLAKMYPSREFATEDIFLRWNWKSTQYENPVIPDRVVSNSDIDKELIGRAFDLSKKSPDWWRQVGSLIVPKNGVYIEAFNHHLPHNQSINVNGDPR
ncbi:MAG: dCMP deaminase, partial [Bacteroidota bacterium]|nr:dCMP deaminase [Bacteroidota bacterium]